MRCGEQVQPFRTKYSTVIIGTYALEYLGPRLPSNGFLPKVKFLLPSFSSLQIFLDTQAALVLLVAANELVSKEPEPIVEPIHDLPVETRSIQVELAQLVTRHLVPDHGAAEPA